MASTYSTSNRFDKQGTGDNPSTWGTRLNERVFDMVDESLDGVLTLDISSITSYTLTTNQGTTDQARKRTLVISGTATAAATVTVPALNKWYLVKCSYTGDYVTTIKTASDAGVDLTAGDSAILYVTPSGVFEVFKLSGLLQADNNLSELTDLEAARSNLGLGNPTINTFTNDGSTTNRTLTQDPGTINSVMVIFDGVVQTPTTDYTLSGTTLTYTSAPANGTKELIFIGNQSLPAGEPSDGSVTLGKLSSSLFASLSDWASGTVDKLLTAVNFLPAVKAALGVNSFEDSGARTITFNSTLVINHSLGVTPTEFVGWIECTANDGNYVKGDIVYLSNMVFTSATATAFTSGFQIKNPTATQYSVQMGGTWVIIDGTTSGTRFSITAAKWKLHVRAKA